MAKRKTKFNMAKSKTKFNISKLSKAAKWVANNPKKLIAAKAIFAPNLAEMIAMPFSAGKGSTVEENTPPKKYNGPSFKEVNSELDKIQYKNSGFKMKYKKSSFPFKSKDKK